MRCEGKDRTAVLELVLWVGVFSFCVCGEVCVWNILEFFFGPCALLASLYVIKREILGCFAVVLCVRVSMYMYLCCCLITSCLCLCVCEFADDYLYSYVFLNCLSPFHS